MKTLYILFVVATFFSLSFSGISSSQNCKIMKSGTFTYRTPTDVVKVVIKGNRHVEYHQNGKYLIKSNMKWISECEYNMTMTEVTIPDFPYSAGDVMNVKINRVEGNEIFYTSTVQGYSWEGQFTKIK